MSNSENILSRLRNSLPSGLNGALNNSAGGGSGFSMTTLVYVLVGAFLIYIVGLMLLNKPVDLSWLDPRPKGMKAKDDAYLFWKPSSTFTNLLVKANSVPGFMNSEYSTDLDVLLRNTRNFSGTGGPWRQIMHRGSGELAVTTVGGAAIRGGCSRAGNFGPLPPFGLPKRMNPGIFLDPNKNDIIVFVDTMKGGESYRESVRIVDIPMDIPFRFGVTINGKLLEIYLNCRLEVSKVLAGTPRPVEDAWYGIAGSAAAQAQIQNLYVWKRALPPDERISLCSPARPVFDRERPLCDAADAATNMEIGPFGKKPVDNVSYGGSLDKCVG
jgi:hypothetical protein